MQQEVFQISDQLVQITNYEYQNVNSLLTPNLMFINQLVEVKNKKYYRLIIWLDYKHLTKQFLFTKDLVFKKVKFELLIKNQNKLEKIAESEIRDQLVLKFDEQQRRIMNDQQEYFTYLIEEKYLTENNLEFIYQLNFENSNYKEFLNSEGVGLNKGTIKIDLKGQLVNQQVEIPEIIAYLVNDTWTNKKDFSFSLLWKKYNLTFFNLNYLYQDKPIVLQIDVVTRKQKPLAILTQNYLKGLINEVENNYISDDVLVNEIGLNSNEKLNKYYDNLNLKYLLKKVNQSYEVRLNSNWFFDYDQNKVILTNEKLLVFNPFVNQKQWLTISYTLSNKKFISKINLQDQKIKLSYQPKELNYEYEQKFVFSNQERLTYYDYAKVKNEN